MIPNKLLEAMRPVTVVVGHYGAGKTNLVMNLALDLSADGRAVTVIDLDVVNPYFRASEQRELLEAGGARLVAPIFSEFGTSLDVPSLTGRIDPAIRDAGEGEVVLVDAGGDDVGATALGRFARTITCRDHAVLYVANRFRNLVADPHDALQNLREVEQAAHLKVTGLVNNSHLKDQTTAETVQLGAAYARELSRLADIPVVCNAVSNRCDAAGLIDAYPVRQLVKNPWE